jgi:hypothetical protein
MGYREPILTDFHVSGLKLTRLCDIIDPGDSPREMVNHYRFDCPTYEIARDELLDKIDGDEFHLSDTMLDADHNRTRH